MAYDVKKTDNTSIIVNDGTTNESLDIVLVGKNYTGYGLYLNQNSVRMLENFSSASAPAAPLTGQIWYDSGNNLAKVYNGSSWKNIGSATADSSAPSGANQGDLWYDTTTKQIKAYNGSTWDLVGPDYTNSQQRSGQVIETLSDGVSNYVVVSIYIGGAATPMAIFSTSSAFSPSPAISGFASIKPGLNLNTNLNAKVANADLLDGLDSLQFMRSDTDTGTSGNLAITSATASTSTTTGALKVSGGAGIAGNINAGNISATGIAGTLSTAAQPNITSVGTLTALTVTGNVAAGNLSGTSIVGTLTTAAQTNITSVGTLTALTVTGNVSAGNLSGTSIVGTLTTAAQTNITSVGTLTALTVTGNIAAGNLSAATVSTASGNLTLAPAANVQVSSNMNITATTDTTSLTDGALVVAGGVAVQGKLRANIGLYTDNLYYANGVAYPTTTGTVNSGTATRLTYYATSGSTLSDTGAGLTYTVGTSTLNVTNISATKVSASVGYSPTLTLTDGTTVSWNTAQGQTAKITLGGNRTMAAPTNLLDGAFYNLQVIQDGTGSRTMSWNSVFKWIGGAAPDLSTTAGANDFFTFRSDGTNLYEQGRAQGVA